MFALGIRYLNGWAMAAADGAKKELAEWPPHPDRVFMALVAAHFEGDRRSEARAALEWLETLPPPEIAASAFERRAIVTHYVPVNDAASPAFDPERAASVSDALLRSGLGLLPEHRSRQARQFPVAIPEEDSVYLVWRDVEAPDEVEAALSALCAEVTCIGHSASLVQMWLADAPTPPNWKPAAQSGAERYLRVPITGRLKALAQAYNESDQVSWIELERAIEGASGRERQALKAERKHRFDDRRPSGRRPPEGFPAGYVDLKKPEFTDQNDTAAVRSVFSDRLPIFRQVAGTRLGLESTLALTQVLRDFLLKCCPIQPPPEWYSGHAGDGRPSRDPHLATFPLPHVGYRHAEGHLLGVAVAIPAEIAASEIGRCLAPLIALNDRDGLPVRFRLYSGKLFEAEFQLDLADDPPVALTPETWTGPTEGASTWATVTPIVLDRHGKSADPWRDAEETIALACERIGLPRPEHLVLGPVSHFIGVPTAGGKRGGYPHLSRKEGGHRHHVHAAITFPVNVRGPVLIGAGRFRGYGLCRPWPPQGSSPR